MNSIKDPAKNAIVDFINDEAYYSVKKSKAEIEKATLGIYIFATLSLLLYVIFLLMNRKPFEWIDFIINILVVIIYYCIAVYSSYEPFTAFVSMLCILGIVLLLEIFLSSQLNIRGLIIKTILIVYISMRLEAAKKVQDYERKPVK